MRAVYKLETPAFIPKRQEELPRLLEAAVGLVRGEVLRTVEGFVEARTCEGLLHLEEELVQLLAVAASHITAGIVSFLHNDKDWVRTIINKEISRDNRRLRHRGNRNIRFHFRSGAKIRMQTPYLSEDRSKHRGRKRNVGRRGKAGGGMYPILMSLGFIAGSSPALASEVAKQSVRTSSFEEAHEALSEQGIHLDKKTVRRITLTVGDTALQQRKKRLEAAKNGERFSDEFVGKRVVISADGGRIRTRQGGLRGRKGKKGRRRYRTPWREPKLIIAYTIDENGKKLPNIAPLYDATLGNADDAFEILIAELKLHGASDAKEIILIADGARWIWNRAGEILASLNFPHDKFTRVTDFYHAVEHLSEISDMCASWDYKKRKKWVQQMRKHLRYGEFNVMVDSIKLLCRGRNAKKIRIQLNYFVNRRDSMRYKEFKLKGMPLGSGAVESAIRRVINLRLKGVGIFWREPNAEIMLHLRSYLKARRWSELISRVMHRTPSGTSL